MRNIYRNIFAAIVALALLVILPACSSKLSENNSQQPTQQLDVTYYDTITPAPGNAVSDITPTQAAAPEAEPEISQGALPSPVLTSDLKVHFIDVGQGDSIFIESAGRYMLIDAGENDQGDKVVDYLNAAGVTRLDYVIGTHPHSDHIGGLDTVINNFDISKVIMPDTINSTDTFEEVLDAIDNKGLKITKPVVGDTYSLGDASFVIISPNSSSYDDLNNYSVGIKLTYGSNSFILAGDAEDLSENEMLDNGIDLSADVIKLGHHGSFYSSSDAYLDAINPAVAVISVGTGNQYGHPDAGTLQKVKDRDINLFRTDKQGTVIFTSNGKNISVNMAPYKITASDLADSSEDNDGSNTATATPGNSNGNDVIVYITETGSKYHSEGCRYLSDSCISIALKDAIAQGYDPCSVCDPPEE